MVAPTEEESLVRLAQSGDPRAIMALVERYQATVYRFGRRMCQSEQDAEDVLQETLLTLVQKIGEFRGDASLSSWLFTIVRSRCRLRRRRADRQTSSEGLEVLDSSPRPDETVSTRELRGIVEAAVRQLEPKYREVLLLRDVEGLSAPEVSEALRLTVPAVKSRLHRARAQVRELVERGLAAHGIPPPALPADAPQGLDLGEMLSQYLEGELTGLACARLETHLAESSGCLEACQGLRRVLGECRTWGHQKPPQRVAESVRAAIRSLLDSAGGEAAEGGSARRRRGRVREKGG
jgi:RNA polymerase sigma-70 factor (ECF subfamily)